MEKCADQDILSAWFLDTFVADCERGYALMNPVGHANKYTRRNERITLGMVRGAFNSETRRTRAGDIWQTVPYAYATTPQTTSKPPLARTIALDIDTGGRLALLRVLTVCNNYGISAFAQESESATHIGGHVRILTDELLPASMLHEIGQRLALAAQVEAEIYPTNADLRLPLMPNLRAPGGPRRFPLIFQNGEIVDTRDPWAALATLRTQIRTVTTAQITKLLEELPSLLIGGGKRRPRHRSDVNGQSPSSIINWFNDSHDIYSRLETDGATFKSENQRVICCPYHDDKSPSLAIWRHQDSDKFVCHCFSKNSNCPAARGAYLDAFNLYCLHNNLLAGDAVKRLVEDHQLGRKRETTVVENPSAIQLADVTLDALAAHQQLIAKARYRLIDELVTATTQRGKITVIRASMGLGKTHAAAELANRLQAEGKAVAVFAPTLDVAQNEWLPRLKSGFVWRSKIDTCTCRDKRYLEWCLRFGYKIPTCISLDCPYARQAQQAFGKVVIYQHAHLALADFPQFDILIVDESPLAALLPEKYLTNGTLAGFTKRYPNDPAAPLVQALHDAALELPQTMQDVRGQTLITEIEKHLPGMTLAEAVSRARTSIHNTLAPQPPPTEIGMMHQFLAGLIDVIGTAPEALSFGRSSAANNKHCYVWHNRATLSEKTRSALLPPAILVLDGSADEMISRKLYEPWPVHFVDISCPVSPLVEITQITCTASTRHVVKEDRLIGNLADSVAVACAQVGVKLDGGITYMAAVDILQERLGGAWLHYGAQRGSNELANASAVAIVASPTTPPAALERKSLALWPDIACGWYKAGATGLYNAQDSRLQAMNQLHAMEELRQSAYRARPLTADKPMHLLIFTPWGLDTIGLQPNRTITELAHGSSTEAKNAVEKYQTIAGNCLADPQPTATFGQIPIVYKYYEDVPTIGNDEKVAVEQPPPLPAKEGPAVRPIPDLARWNKSISIAHASDDHLVRQHADRLDAWAAWSDIDRQQLLASLYNVDGSLVFMVAQLIN